MTVTASITRARIGNEADFIAVFTEDPVLESEGVPAIISTASAVG